jgi:hypothetical protein
MKDVHSTITYFYSPCDVAKEEYSKCLALGGKNIECFYLSKIYTACSKEEIKSK